MKALLDFLNSNFGGIVSGAIISGLFVHFITSSWQRRSWVFQQQFAAAKTDNEATLTKWESIRTQHEQLDLAIYELSQARVKLPESALTLLETISSLTVELSRQMIADIQEMRRHASVMNDKQEKEDQELTYLVQTRSVKHRTRKPNRAPSS